MMNIVEIIESLGPGSIGIKENEGKRRLKVAKSFMH